MIFDIVKGQFRRLIGDRNYCIAREYYHHLISRLQGKPFLFVHTMGKVGSSTIFDSLTGAGLNETTTIYRTHFLSPEGVKFLERLDESGYGGWRNLPSNIKSLIASNQVLGALIRKGYLARQKCRVITLVRDPIATNISGFFQNYAWWPAKLVNKCRNRSPNYLDELIARFLEMYPHDVPITWFDSELKSVFGIDVFATEFPKSLGYKIFYAANVEVLVIKLEKLDRCAEEAFEKFLGLKGFVLRKQNLASGKWYMPIYHEFIDAIVLPDACLRRMYDCKHTRHFYTDQEIDHFKRIWSKSDAFSLERREFL